MKYVKFGRTGIRPKLLATVAGLLAMVLAFSQIGLAHANSVSMNTGGCTGTASSWQYYINDYASSTSSSCAYQYLYCYWQLQGGGIYHGCPGWVQYSPGFHFNGTIGVSSYHSLCAAGGPCLDSQYYHTSAGTFYG